MDDDLDEPPRIVFGRPRETNDTYSFVEYWNDDDANGFNYTVFGGAPVNLKKGVSKRQGAVVVVAMLLVGIVLCAVIFYVSRKQERLKRKKKQNKLESKGKELASGLIARKWYTGNAVEDSGTENLTRTSQDDTETSEGDESPPSSNRTIESTKTSTTIPLGNREVDVDEMAECIRNNCTNGCSHTSASIPPSTPATSPEALPSPTTDSCLECQICSSVFQNGDTVVESNNPNCCHTFHKVCMEKWLTFQYSCPICNQVYVLHTATSSASQL